jgi:anti-sigma regulatory factor (Ser/Thr protein kinase)
VAVASEGDEFKLEVTNSFDPGAEPERTMHGRLQSFDASGSYLGERGRGLFLIARIADGLQIRSLPGDRIRVVATKRLRGEPPLRRVSADPA